MTKTETKTKTDTSTLLNPMAHDGVPGHKDPNEKHVEAFFETQDAMEDRAKAMNRPDAVSENHDTDTAADAPDRDAG